MILIVMRIFQAMKMIVTKDIQAGLLISRIEAFLFDLDDELAQNSMLCMTELLFAHCVVFTAYE